MNYNYGEHDLAGDQGGLELNFLMRILADVRNEPKWRDSADKCADYYDHKQASQEWLERARQTGEPVTIVNLIQRTINGALGQEAKTRLNWKIETDSDAFEEQATFLGERLAEAQREANSDMAISDAYSSMLRTGIGWVEVSKNTDPLAYPIRFTSLHRRDVFWDWRARESDKSDARWMLRKRWVDLDEAISIFPQFREQLEVGCHTGPITDMMNMQSITSRGNFDNINAARRAFGAEDEWLLDGDRKRVLFYSVYYKSFKKVVALVNGSRRVRFNPSNPIHAALVQGGGAKLVEGPSYEIRHAMFAGPYRLFDVSLKSRQFPLIPFVCYSADDDQSPYGLVHGMIEPQDDFNKRRSRLRWLLSAKQVFVDDDALHTKQNSFAKLANEVMRPDAMFVLNSNRRNPNGLRIEQNMSLSAEQTRVMDDSKNLIQDQPGLFSPQFGSNAIGAKSGVALNSLMEQSSASLGETSDNYRSSRRSVGDAAMDLIAKDYMMPNMRVEVGTGKRRRLVVLNSITPDGLIINNMDDCAVKVALGDVPVTAAYKAQQYTHLANALASVGNDQAARAILLPALIEAGDTEHRHHYAMWLRKKYGVPEPDDMGSEDAAAKEQEQLQQQQQTQKQQMQMQAQAQQAQIAKDASVAQLNNAKANRLQTPEPQQPQLTEDDLIQQALAEAMA